MGWHITVVKAISGTISPMLLESDVIAAVSDCLRTEGYEILQQLSETQRGDDIVAARGDETMLIEAKGETSSKEGSKKYGRPFSRSQVLDHVAMAFYRAVNMRRGGVQVGMAFPENAHHKEMVSDIKTAVRELKIFVFWVSKDGLVTVEK